MCASGIRLCLRHSYSILRVHPSFQRPFGTPSTLVMCFPGPYHQQEIIIRLDFWLDCSTATSALSTNLVLRHNFSYSFMFTALVVPRVIYGSLLTRSYEVRRLTYTGGSGRCRKRPFNDLLHPAMAESRIYASCSCSSLGAVHIGRITVSVLCLGAF